MVSISTSLPEIRPGGIPGISWANRLQLLMVVLLVAGSISGEMHICAIAVFLAVVATLLHWGRLLKLARFFVLAALAAGLLVSVIDPQSLPLIARALLQGASFAALMMVLGMLRHPARRSVTVRHAVEYLLSFNPRNRYAAINIGAHFLSLLFNVGMIAMIGDLTRAPGSDRPATDPGRRSLVIAGMRGAALVSIWSPIGLGFAIVTTGIPSLDALAFLSVAFLFSMLVLCTSAFLPLLPEEASMPVEEPCATARPSSMPLTAILGVCALLLALTICASAWWSVSFTIASVAILPVFSALWLWLEKSPSADSFRHDASRTLSGLSDLSTESAIFMAANVIGATISVLIHALPVWNVIEAGHYSALPVLLVCLAGLPLAAALFIPNAIALVIIAQLLGTSTIGIDYPVALALTLSIGWAASISASPISAMSLMTGSLCGVSSRHIAHRWNLRFVLTVLGLGAVFVCLAAILPIRVS